jgi:hypothetical protein
LRAEAVATVRYETPPGQQLQIDFGSTSVAVGGEMQRIHLFVATGLVAGEAQREADEFMELVPTRLSVALAMIKDGAIQDAKTALALLYTAAFRMK